MMKYFKNILKSFLFPLISEEKIRLRDYQKTRETVENLLGIEGFADYLPYLAFLKDENIFINKNSIGFVLEAIPLTSAKYEVQVTFSQIFQYLLPEGSNLQFTFISSPKIGDYLDKYQEYKEQTPNKIFQKLAERRALYFKENNTQHNEVSFTDYKLYISYSEPLLERNEEEEVIVLERLKSIREQISTIFKSNELYSRSIDAESLIRVIDDILSEDNNITSSDLNYNKYEPLCDQIVSNDTLLEVNKDYISVRENDKVFKSYSVKNYPSRWSLSLMNNFIGDLMNSNRTIRTPFIIHFGTHIPNDPLLKSKILAKSMMIDNQAENRSLIKFNSKLTKQSEELHFVRRSLESDGRIVFTHYQVILYGKKRQVEVSEQILIMLYRAHGWQLVSDKFIHLPALLNAFPMSWGEKYWLYLKGFRKCKTSLSHESAVFMPIQGEWKGTVTPGLLLSGRRGQIFYFNPFDNKGNYNMCITGMSGSGKSVFMQELVTSVLSMGGKVFIIDIGRSYENICTLLKGNFVEFTPRSNLKLNPFTNIDDTDLEEFKEIIRAIKGIIQVMASPFHGTTSIENSFIEQAIFKAWELKRNKANIQDVIDALFTLDDPRAHDVGQMLFPFGEKGTYGGYFNTISNFDITSDLNVYELDDIKDKNDLLAVVFQIILIQINTVLLQKYRSVPCLIVIDESWRLLSSTMGNFIEEWYRITRKLKACIAMGTQQIADFFKNESTKTCFNNSAWKCTLQQSNLNGITDIAEKDNIKEGYPMDNHQKALVSSLNTIYEKYSEIMIDSPNGYCIGRLYLDNYSKVLYSTTKEVKLAVYEQLNQGKSIEDAVSEVERKIYGI
ncbi:MAG: type IV secretion system protein TraC [Sphingobacteriia bacterium]|nr:type IV secretion system protein TraC [Sphingobacteriia bacterium]